MRASSKPRKPKVRPLSGGDLKQLYVSEPKKTSACFVSLTVDGRDVKIPEDVALAAVRDLGLSMGEYASPEDYVHSVSIFLAALKKEGFCLALSCVLGARPEGN